MKRLLLFTFFLHLSFASAQTEVTAENVYKLKSGHKCLRPSKSTLLNDKIKEGSGLVGWNGRLWTHNDSGDPILFAIDTATGQTVEEFLLPGITNKDWEDITQDSLYFYLGAIGNNMGSSEKLDIHRISKLSLLEHKPVIDKITFAWPKTEEYGEVKTVNFDCEAMLVVGDSIYLFTKEWKTRRCTRVFSIPKQPGNYMARYKSTLKTKVLVTGASFYEKKKQLVLCGYNLLLQPFLLVFPEVKGTEFFAGKCTKMKVKRWLHQAEGITTFDGQTYFLINEDFRFLFVNMRQRLHRLELKN